MTRPTVKSLIEVDLGYCCLHFFFTRFRDTQTIADRLGFSNAAVRRSKALVDDGLEVCQKCPGKLCLNDFVTLRRTRRVYSVASRLAEDSRIGFGNLAAKGNHPPLGDEVRLFPVGGAGDAILHPRRGSGTAGEAGDEKDENEDGVMHGV